MFGVNGNPDNLLKTEYITTQTYVKTKQHLYVIEN